jgi:putative nucleotidyltransferase with HDIG domain
LTPLVILRALSGLRRSLALYPSGHTVIEQAIDELERVLEQVFVEHDRVRIELVDKTAHLEGYPFRVESHSNADALEELQRLEIECLQIERGVERDELAEMAGLLHRLGDRVPEDSMRGLLLAEGVKRVTMTRLVPVETRFQSFEWPSEPESILEPGYARALDDAHDSIGAIFEGGTPDAQSLHQLLAWISEQVADSTSALSQILSVKRYENHTYCHSVNVATLAMLLGRRIGLEEAELMSLSEAALLHDVGKRQIPSDILTKPGPLNRREWRIVQRHPVIGASILTRASGFEPLTPTVALEHHREYGGGGYPDLEEQRPHLLSQIVAVVDTYEALTGARPYREPLVPEEACLILARMAGEKLNPALVKAFVSLVTFFPLGSVVRTSLGEIGVVIDTSEDDPLHPVIRLGGGGLDSPGTRIDTADRDAGGEYVRHIVETLPRSVADPDPEPEPLAASA